MKDCIEFHGRRTKKGYGWLCIDGKKWSAHRLSYTLNFGPIPEGMCVCHTCDNPPCINPDHLFLGTNADNVADRVAKGRSRGGDTKGEAHYKSKLTNDIVRAILLETDVTGRELAKRYGVSYKTISKVRAGRTWKHLKYEDLCCSTDKPAT